MFSDGRQHVGLLFHKSFFNHIQVAQISYMVPLLKVAESTMMLQKDAILKLERKVLCVALKVKEEVTM